MKKTFFILTVILLCAMFLTGYGEKSVLTGFWEVDLVTVARGELGYEESRTNYKTVDFINRGYTKYGHWYGYDYMDWCVCFVSYCARQAGIPLNLRAGAINQLIQHGKDYKAYFAASRHEPEKGDIFFRTSEDPYAIRENIISHCGIVEDVNDTIIYTIEGNVDGKVVRKVYFRNDPVLCSYISIWALMKAGGITVVDNTASVTPGEFLSDEEMAAADALEVSDMVRISKEEDEYFFEKSRN